MVNEFPEKLLKILLEISNNLESVQFWKDYTFWISLTSVIIWGVTLYFLRKYTTATESMAKYQITPAVDVNMVYEKSIKKTYFWFSNDSSLPGIVYLEFQKNKESRKMLYKPLRIPPKRSMKTATTFEFSPIEGDEITIYVSIKPALEQSNTKFKFEKSYTFTQNQWNENSWSYPDPPFQAI